MTPLERFAVVRVPFPFSDRQASKRRPAVVRGTVGSMAQEDQVGVAANLRALLPPGTEGMPRAPLAWMPLLRHWTRFLGEGGEELSPAEA
jgi:hypothetical protein